jgi:hypothetical protein
VGGVAIQRPVLVLWLGEIETYRAKVLQVGICTKLVESPERLTRRMNPFDARNKACQNAFLTEFHFRWPSSPRVWPCRRPVSSPLIIIPFRVAKAGERWTAGIVAPAKTEVPAQHQTHLTGCRIFAPPLPTGRSCSTPSYAKRRLAAALS